MDVKHRVYAYLPPAPPQGPPKLTESLHPGGREGDEGDNVIRNETVETSDKEVFIPVPPGCENAVVEFHRRNGQKAADSERVELVKTEDMTMFRLSLEDYGEYMLNVYTEPTPGSGKVRNVAKYQVGVARGLGFASCSSLSLSLSLCVSLSLFLSVCLSPVSYTHLTLPTSSEV